MKLNKEFILKNLMGIICAVIILALFLPFMSVKAEVSVLSLIHISEPTRPY